MQESKAYYVAAIATIGAFLFQILMATAGSAILHQDLAEIKLTLKLLEKQIYRLEEELKKHEH